MVFFPTLRRTVCGDHPRRLLTTPSSLSLSFSTITGGSSSPFIEVDFCQSEPRLNHHRLLHRPGWRATDGRHEPENPKEASEPASASDTSSLVDAMVRSTLRMVQGSGKSLHVVAFSGGVDSALATALLQRAVAKLMMPTMTMTTTTTTMTTTDAGARDTHYCHRRNDHEEGFVENEGFSAGRQERGGNHHLRRRRRHHHHHHHRVRAVLGVSPAVSREQLEQATRVARELRVTFQTVPTSEGKDPTYVANAGLACRACKTHLYSTLESIHRAVVTGETETPDDKANAMDRMVNPRRFHPPLVQLYNGTNADDLLDPTRVGLRAAEEFGVLSPLREYSKRQVRIAARHLGLSVWNAAASPCLRSRLALGVPATALHLGRIEAAERRVRDCLASVFTAESNVRVRMLAGNKARIEVDPTVMDDARRVDWDHELVGLGFAPEILLCEFRSGSVASSPGSVGGDST
jgi:PP-loop superfamily ATP-utilizing enzyme